MSEQGERRLGITLVVLAATMLTATFVLAIFAIWTVDNDVQMRLTNTALLLGGPSLVIGVVGAAVMDIIGGDY